MCRATRMIKTVTLYYFKVNGTSCGKLGVSGLCISLVVVVGGTLLALILLDQGEKASSRPSALLDCILIDALQRTCHDNHSEL